MPVEVERKFVCDSDIQEKLKNIGAVYIGQFQFKDQYFDSADFTLTLRDYWLRKRDESWELKCPAFQRTKLESSTKELCTNYKEITDLSQIKTEVTKIMNNCTAPNEEASDSSQKKEMDQVKEDKEGERWLKEMKLACFAEYSTTRCSYMLEKDGEGSGVRIDLDQADYGYCVGEIEVLLSDGEDMESALQKIEKTAEKLGLGSEKKIQGKMNVYLQRYRPEHYAKLLGAVVL